MKKRKHSKAEITTKLAQGNDLAAACDGCLERASSAQERSESCGRSFEISVENLEAAIFFGAVAAAAPSVLHLTALGAAAGKCFWSVSVGNSPVFSIATSGSIGSPVGGYGSLTTFNWLQGQLVVLDGATSSVAMSQCAFAAIKLCLVPRPGPSCRTRRC
jgi:hypothetical protein